MNLGQFLTAKSPLPSGTVAQHLAAIAASVGTGTGTGETVFASMFSVQIEQPSITVTRRTKRAAREERPAVQPSRSPAPAKQDNNLSVFTTQPAVTVLTAPDEITVLQRTESVVATTRLASETITRKPVATAINYVYPSINIVN